MWFATLQYWGNPQPILPYFAAHQEDIILLKLMPTNSLILSHMTLVTENITNHLTAVAQN